MQRGSPAGRSVRRAHSRLTHPEFTYATPAAGDAGCGAHRHAGCHADSVAGDCGIDDGGASNQRKSYCRRPPNPGDDRGLRISGPNAG